MNPRAESHPARGPSDKGPDVIAAEENAADSRFKWPLGRSGDRLDVARTGTASGGRRRRRALALSGAREGDE